MTKLYCHHNQFDVCGRCTVILATSESLAHPSQPVPSSPAAANDGAA